MEINNIPTPITPSRYSYSPTGSFKFWCQKVLPTVYDDSLSYYEILCKVVNYLNEVIKNVDGLNEDITTMYSSFDELQSRLITAYAELEGYVNTYFDNLDVQNEINEKLDAMARTGALTSLISPFIPSLVTAWLDQHVVPTSPAIDKTLSIADAGADAKVVGDRIREDEIDIVRAITYSGLGYSPFNTRYINGDIDNEGHVTTTNDITNHVITSRATTSSRIVTLNADSGYQFRVFGYDSSDNYTGEMTDGWTTSYTFPANSSFRLLIAMSPDSANNKLYPTMAMSRVRYRSGIGYDVDELKISAELTNDINENYKYETYRLGQGYVSFYTNYVNGNIDSNGRVTVGTPLTRVVTSLMHIATRDVPVTSYNNIVFRVFEYTSADSFVREKTSGWTNSYTIPNNLYFRLLISRNPEGTATLTPNTAKSHVIYPDTIATRISTLESDETRFKNCMVSRFPRKKVSIIGDSIETWDEEGYKIDGYRMYYPNNDMDLHDVSDTWWYKVIVASGSLLEVNASYSGSRVTKTSPNPDYPDLWERISVIGNPNLVYIALGTNDSAGNVALGEYDFTSSIESLSRTQFRPALIKGIKGIYQSFPQTTIVYIIERMADEYKESIKYICLQLGVKYVDVSSYYGGGVHPPVRGMREIASMVLTKTDDELLQSGFPADAKIVGEQINKTNANVIDIDNNYKYETYRLGQGYSSVYASYINGDIDSNGVVTEGIPVTRVVSSLVSYSGRDIPLLASDGYQFRVFSYNSQGTYQSELTSGWSQSYTVPNGTYFRLLISRNPEGTSRLAPNTGKSHIIYLNTIGVNVQNNTNEVSALKADLSDVNEFSENLLNFVEIVPYDTTSSYWYRKATNILSTNKKYVLKITFEASATIITIQAGTRSNSDYMVDTIYSGEVVANKPVYVYDYVPSTAGIRYFRSSANVPWSLDLYEVIVTDEIVYSLQDATENLNTFGRIVNKENLFVGAHFVENKYYYAGVGNNTNYSYFEVNVESGKSYIFGSNVYFISSASTGISNSTLYTGTPYTAQSTEKQYFTVLNEHRSKWAMCESTVDVAIVGTYDAPTLSVNILKQESGTGKSQVMSQKAITDAIADATHDILPTNIDGITIKDGTDLLILAEVTEGKYAYVQNDMLKWGASASYKTYKIPAKQGTYTCVGGANFVIPVTADDTPLDYVDSLTLTITCPALTEYLYLSVSSAHWEEFKIGYGTAIPSSTKYNFPMLYVDTSEIENKIYGKGYARVTGVLSNGQSFTLARTNVKKNNVFSFLAKITSFSSILIGHGKNAYDSSYLVIDGTKITRHNYTSTDDVREYTHGLTIDDYIYVEIQVGVGLAKVIVYSNQQTYTINETTWIGDGNADIFVESNDSTLTDCVFTWSSTDFRKSVWMFGDSYFSVMAASRWTYYLNQYGFIDNVLLNAYPGEATSGALTALENALTYYGKPKYLIWCLGMNDGADSNENTPSASWMNGVNAILGYCKQYGITPILATIPSVPTLYHGGKNKWVRTSGHRYIDFAKAVGATDAGVWYDGMLSDDGIHPAVPGAIALYFEAIADAPEITFTNP